MVVALVVLGLLVAFVVIEWIDQLSLASVLPDSVGDFLIRLATLGLLCLPMGLVWSQWNTARIEAGWPTTEGTVTAAFTTTEGEPRISYAFRHGASTREAQHYYPDELARGARVTVSYDPQDPTRSTPYVKRKGLAAPVLVTLGTLVVLYGLVRLRRWLRPKRARDLRQAAGEPIT